MHAVQKINTSKNVCYLFFEEQILYTVYSFRNNKCNIVFVGIYVIYLSIRKIWRKFILITRRGNLACHQCHRLFEVFFTETAIPLLLLGIHDEAESLLRATLSKYTNYHHNLGETCFQIMLPCLAPTDLFLFTKICKCYSFNASTPHYLEDVNICSSRGMLNTK